MTVSAPGPQSLDATLKNLARNGNRLRWGRKYEIARLAPPEVSWAARLRFVLTDPEVDTFSYDLANQVQLAAAIATTLGVQPRQVTDLFTEALLDAQLMADINFGSRRDWAVKANPGIGRHLVTYALIRLRKPEVCAEIGVRYGLGTVVALRALAINRQQGHPGTLVSIDVDPFAGRIARRVPTLAELPWWQFVAGESPAVLATALGDQPVDFAIIDSTAEAAVTRAEAQFLLAHAKPGQILLGTAWNDVLAEAARTAGAPMVYAHDEPVAQVVPGKESVLVVVHNPHLMAQALRS